VKKKELSNPFSTGGGGVHFEASVQASFVTLMITGGYAPCLPSWPIVEVKLQGKIDGFDTDDLIVFVEDPDSKERRKLLGQVKHSISITKGSELLGEVLKAAWDDFNNPGLFTKGKDSIVLITGPISATDQHNVCWLLDQAKKTKEPDDFYRRVEQTNFSPPKCVEKLEAIAFHLKAANGSDLSNDRVHEFLRHFHLLGYDLDNETGVSLSLLHSHISQFHPKFPGWAWARVVDVVQTWNKAAGSITTDDLPDDLLNSFKTRLAEIPDRFPKELAASETASSTDWGHHPGSTLLALATLIGSWNEKNENDMREFSALLGTEYDSWVDKAREILHSADSPLSVKDGVWKVAHRPEMLSLLGSRILDQNLDTFRAIAIRVLKERDPAFDLATADRYAANIYGKMPSFSPPFRKGVSEGLALLGNYPDAPTNCSNNKAEKVSVLAVREILSGSDWVVWGSLNNLLPTLAEAAPTVFLDAVESALRQTPCPFDEIFAQEGNGLTGSNYLTGLLWGLESLAWDAELLVRVCVVLGELASRDPGGNWANRPSNSLATILLPWLPQTLGSPQKRLVAVRTVLNEQPKVGWNLLLHLLPGHHQTSSGSHRPSWRKTIPEDWSKGVTQGEYRQQITAYAELAIDVADSNPERLSQLASRFDDLPRPAFERLLSTLRSDRVRNLPEGQRREVWDALITFTSKHRRFADAEWALPGNLVEEIEEAAKGLAPTNPFDLYQHLFSERDFDLYEENGDWEEQQRRLGERRETAISEILRAGGVSDVVRFAETVKSPRQVGHALGGINDESIDRYLLPSFLGQSGARKHFVDAYVWRRHVICGWDWCDRTARPEWTLEQKARFLCQLPFVRETWERVDRLLGEEERLYWTAVWANPYQSEGADLAYAIDKLIEYNRANAAIDCLSKMLHDKQSISVKTAVQALLAVNADSGSTDTHDVVQLIQFLQSDSNVSEEDLFRVEWAYLPLLDSYGRGKPQLLERKLATDPEFFCELIRLIYRSNKAAQDAEERSDSTKSVATNAWRLLHDWSMPPGTQSDGTFSGQLFLEWLETVKRICSESGHLDVALIEAGEVLIHTPPDPNGLWIDEIVAASLNGRDNESLRRGFTTAIYNSRGVHWVDPTGKPEMALAEQYRRKAEDVENAGFQRLAATLKEVAASYEREAQQVRAEHNNEKTDA